MKSSRIRRHGWSKPSEDFVKLSVDAAFDHDRGAGGTGTILCDENGFFLAVSCSDIHFVEDAATTEARGLRDKLLLAKDVGCKKFMVETDCIEVIEMMQNGGNSLGPASAI